MSFTGVLSLFIRRCSCCRELPLLLLPTTKAGMIPDDEVDDEVVDKKIVCGCRPRRCCRVVEWNESNLVADTRNKYDVLELLEDAMNVMT
jgi:hypothetical protein